jgi:hypothetical protein
MIVGVAAYAQNASSLKDVLDQFNVCDDCWHGRTPSKPIIFEG